MLAAFFDDIRDHDLIVPRRLAARLRLPMSGLAKLAHVNRNTMTAKPQSPAIQAKLGQIAAVIARAAELSGDEGRAIIWFKHVPIVGFGKTAEELVEEGHADAVMWTLESMEQGVYA
ncbi:hypothetical protein [Sphingomonas sp.]|jgi:uncharacterized protein (DUF2384 family)|uniref:hypothetical protein n=1 Tax=Sphingomonas sp. TaxID=28214 RepID=UPI002D7F1130|nr:hypothetical protein [Sphingomonas sp.]HEU0043824.1 hypothetical protein [Sphingomonas sp.]